MKPLVPKTAGMPAKPGIPFKRKRPPMKKVAPAKSMTQKVADAMIDGY